MDRLWALKKEFDPFGPLFYGISAIGFLLRITRCAMYSCPYCRWPFKISWGPSNSLLGSGDRVSWHCKKAFWDGSNEWPEMSSQDRHPFLGPTTVAGYLAAVLLIGGLLAYDRWYFKLPASRVDPTVAVALISRLPVWFGFRTGQVIRSIRRYNHRRRTSTV